AVSPHPNHLQDHIPRTDFGLINHAGRLLEAHSEPLTSPTRRIGVRLTYLGMALTCVWRRIGVAAAGTIISPLKPDATFNLMKSPGDLSRPNRSMKTNDKTRDGIATKDSARATLTINAGAGRCADCRGAI